MKLILTAVVLISVLRSAYGKPSEKLIRQNSNHDVNAQLMQIIESYMNRTADPCQDFHAYACGNFKKISTYASAYTQQDGIYNQILVDLFEKLKQQENEIPKSANKLNLINEQALLYYKSCRELPKMYELDKFLTPQLTSESFVWWKLLAQLQGYDLQDVMLRIVLNQQEDESKKFYIFLTEQGTELKLNLTENVLKSMETISGLDRKELKTKLEAYEAKMKLVLEEIEREIELEMTVESKSDKSKDSGVDSADNVNETMKSAEIEENSEYMTLSDLQQQIPEINWRTYFNIMLHDSIKLPNDITFSSPSIKIVKKLIKYFNDNNERDLQLYLLTHFLMQLEANLPPEITALRCAQLVRDFMSLSINQLYEDYYYADVRARSDAVINSVFQRLKSKLNDLFVENHNDLDESEIEYIQRKNNNIHFNIGNMPANGSLAFLLDYYAHVNITNSTNFYHNHLELLKNRLQIKYRILLAYQISPKNVYESFDASLGWDNAASPYNLFSRSKIIIPFAYLQLPFYHHELQDLFLYSKLGWVLAHETMHTFDNFGLVYDADNCPSDIIVNILMKPQFMKAIKCMKPQQTASISERIADFSGIYLLMRAYAVELDAMTIEQRKLFFINLSQYFCDRDTTIAAKSKKFSHDQSPLRIAVMLKNTPEFAETFSCNATKSEEICRLW